MKIKSSIRILSILAIALLSCASYAGEKAGLIFQKTPTDRLYDIEILGDEGFAVGENGLIMKTRDGGESWEQEETPTSLALINVAMTQNGAVAVGQLGEIVVKAGDSEWNKIGFETDLRLLGVDMNNRGLAIAVGAFGTLLRSTDGGLSWKQLTPPWASLYDSGSGDTAVIRDEPTNYVVKVFEDDRVVIGGEYGQLLTSNDGGDTWSVTYRHPEGGEFIAPTFFDIKFYGSMGYAVGQAGLLIISRDNGRTWAPVKTPAEGSLFAVAGDESGNIFAIGQRVAIVSRDGGTSWTHFEPMDISLNWYAGLERSKGDGMAKKYVAVGHSGRALSLNPF